MAVRQLVELDGINVVFPLAGTSTVQALSDVSLSIRDGEFLAVVGPSGCGKSTLLRVIAELQEPTSGSVTLHGQADQRSRMNAGVVFQDANLLPWKTVMENVCLPGLISKLPRASYEPRAKMLLEQVGLGQFGDSYPSQLSGGMRQRAAIARGLLLDPDLLLMDEPFGALDAMTREQMNLDLMNIWHETNKTILFITHSISEAVLLADRVVVMTPRPGRIAEIIDVDLRRPRDFSITSSAEFGAMTNRIRRYFSHLGTADEPVQRAAGGESQ